MSRVDRYGSRLPAGQRKPIEVGDLSHRTSAGDRECAAVLFAPVYPVRIPIIGGYLIDLGRLLVVPGAPGLPAIQADHRPLVAAVYDVARVGRIDPPLI